MISRDYGVIEKLAKTFPIEQTLEMFEKMCKIRFFELKTESNTSNHQYRRSLANHPREIGEDPDKRNYVVYNKKIMARGFIPQYSLDYGIQELIKGYSILLKNNPYKNV